ncbi:sugar phosphate isomerase/epimerase family protein [Neorhodopirellula pilleata]|uniref:Xylose isomerase-like TIM barrel n=1 Tax=Neorhodopirellula pilleata TaxID=2714738 RepID=A0A5C6AQ17_9BACT|nr:TIM barrel protein [Neorhodopirellula pilleata]TWU01541.1 Xylose isomerase-like TIM barrel [Neorhodopirellula pilleata]
MIPGYHAGEMWLHEPSRAIRHLAEMGYRSVAIRSRQGICVPGEAGFDAQWRLVLETAISSEIGLVIDTEAPFVLGDEACAMPSLADPDQTAASPLIEWIERWIDAAAMRPGTIVSLASGPPRPGMNPESALEVLAERLQRLSARADSAGVFLTIRPAVSHVIGSVAQFERFRQWLRSGVSLGLAADVGEMIHAGEMPLVARLHRLVDDLRLVYLCDVAGSAHDSDRFDRKVQRDENDCVPGSTVGRMDVPIGSGEVAVQRVVGELAKFTTGVPIIVRVANQSNAGLAVPRHAMRELKW